MINMKNSEELFNEGVWEVLNKIKDKLLPKKGVGDTINYLVDRNIQLPGYKNPLKQDKVLDFLKGEKVFEDKDEPTIVEYSNKGSPEYTVFESHSLKILKNFETYYSKYKFLFNPEISNPKKLVCRTLKIDLTRGSLRFKKNKPININIGSDAIKFLILLMKNKDEILTYRFIAKIIKPANYRIDKSDKTLGREIQFIYRDLYTILKKVKMNKQDIKSFIHNIRTQGYKLS